MKGLEAKTLGLKKVIRHEYKRIVAFMLTVAMVVTNFGTNLTVAFAAGEETSSLFLLDSSELEDAISTALESGDVFDFSSLELKAKQKSLKTSYEKLIGSKAGKVYQLDVDIDSSYATEHTDLQVFYNAGTDDVVFLFINESDMAVTFRANVSGYETARVTVNPNTTNIEDAEGVENAEDYSGTTMVDDEKKPQAEVVKPEGETSESESASDETEAAETEADVTESENASENGETEETTGAENSSETEETTAAEETEAEVEETAEETEAAEPETEAPAAEEEETENHSLTFEGRCWKFGNDIDTDIIIPTQHLNYETMDEIKVHAFEPLRPELAAKLREGDLIVAGNNFGCGSSREQAAEVLVANGVHCVIAKSFARIFFRNAINNGILLLECPDLPDDVNEGDTVKVELDKQQISANGKTYKIPAIPENLYHIIMDGGLVKSIMKKVEKGLL